MEDERIKRLEQKIGVLEGEAREHRRSIWLLVAGIVSGTAHNIYILTRIYDLYEWTNKLAGYLMTQSQILSDFIETVLP